jgi:TolB protein
MTTPSDFDRRLTDWLEETGAPTVPEFVDELLDRTRRTRQRPAWASLERWLPMQVALPRRVVVVPGYAWLVLFALLLMAVVAFAVASGGHRVPPPFGLARTGLIAFDGGGDLYLANADGTGLHALTSGHGDMAPTFSRDGTRIAFWSGASCPGNSPCVGPFSLRVVDADGSRPVTIDQGVGELPDATITWSPDGGRLAYLKTINGTERILVADLRSGTASAIGGPDLDASTPQWSPSGDLIAFIGSHLGGANSVYVAPAAGGPAVKIADPDGAANVGPAFWSPDGSTLVFYAATVEPSDIYSVKADGSGLQDLTNSLDDEFNPVWSNDGTRIAYGRLDAGQPEPDPTVAGVWVMDADGSHQHELSTHGVGGARLIWSPDDRDLLGYGADAANVMVISVDGSHPQTTIPAAGLINADGSFQRLAP